MEKENKVSPVSWIMEWAGTKKIYYVISIIMALFSVLFKIAPYFIIGDVIAKLLDGEDDIKVYAVRVGLVAAAFVLSEIFHSISTTLSHIATFQVLANIRRKCLDKLTRVPLGYVKDTSSGTFKNILVERIDSIETTLAHILPEFTSNLVAPVIVIIYLFMIDWRMA